MLTIANFLLVLLLPLVYAQNALDSFWTDLKSFSADFEQSTFDDKDRLLRKSQGHIDFVAPNRFHISDNHGQTIVADGQWVWIYDRDLNQVIRKRQTHVFREAPAAVLFRGKQLQEVYDITAIGQKNSILWYQARPKQGEAFEVIRLGFCGDTLCQVELQDAFAQKTQISFLNSQKNVPIDEKRFIFHVPDHADIVVEE
jgi:outer membrane lipoprotein carrier protein